MLHNFLKLRAIFSALAISEGRYVAALLKLQKLHDDESKDADRSLPTSREEGIDHYLKPKERHELVMNAPHLILTETFGDQTLPPSHIAPHQYNMDALSLMRRLIKLEQVPSLNVRFVLCDTPLPHITLNSLALIDRLSHTRLHGKSGF